MKRTVRYVEIGSSQVFTVFTEPDQPQGKLVIMAHGFRGSSIGPARTFVDFEQLLVEDGFACLRFDQPGSGNSSGDFAQSSFNTWVDTLVALTERSLADGYKVALLGQSMGASTVIATAARPSLRDLIACILLWVPDPESDPPAAPEGFGEEGGQRYPESFWVEAHNARILDCLDSFQGGIHLVYGEDDQYVSPELRQQTIDVVRRKGQPYMVLAGQGHSSWDYVVAQAVFAEQRAFLARYF